MQLFHFRKNIVGVNILTSIFVIIVIFFHHISYTHNYLSIVWDSKIIFVLSHFAVGGFMFLSAYKLTNSHQRDTAIAFFKNRFIRLYPLYFFAVVLYAAFVVHESSFANLLVHLFLVQELLNELWGSSYTTLYFFSILFICYIFFIWLRTLLKKPAAVIASALIVFFGMFLIRQYQPFDLVFLRESFFAYFGLFVAGMLVAAHESQVRKLFERYQFAILVFCIVCIAGLLLFFNTTISHPLLRILCGTILHAGAFIPIINFVLFTRVRHGRWRTLVTYIATASFVAFLLHRPIWEMMAWLWSPDSFSSNNLLHWLYIVPVGMTVIVVLSYVVQIGYDRFIGRALRSLFR